MFDPSLVQNDFIFEYGGSILQTQTNGWSKDVPWRINSDVNVFLIFFMETREGLLRS